MPAPVDPRLCPPAFAAVTLMTVAVCSLVIAAGLVAVAPVAVASATRQSSASDRRPGAWMAAVRGHVPGQADGALLAVAAWTPREIEGILPQVAGEPDAAHLLAKALVLHADIGIAEHADGVPGGVPVMTLMDGHVSGSRRVSRQWGIGRRIAALLVGLPVAPPANGAPLTPDLVERTRQERRRRVRDWYRATAAVLQQDSHLGFLHTHVNAGLSLLGDDAVLLMYRATVRQAFADPRLQMAARRPRGRFASGWPGLAAVQQASFELDQASRDLRTALELDPHLVEARIRLAHVLADKGRHDEAATLLRTAMAATLPPFLEYYGALVLGRAEEALGRLLDARAAYDRAGRRFPDAQVPRVALSRLALLDGRAREGLDTLVKAPRSSGAEPSDDPWWWYFRSHEPDADALIAGMREAGR